MKEANKEVERETTFPTPVPAHTQQVRIELPVDLFEEAMVVPCADGANSSHRADEGISGAGGGDEQV